MIRVMASNDEEQKPGFSNYGDNVEIVAPGVNIISTSSYYAPIPGEPIAFWYSGISHIYRNFTRGRTPNGGRGADRAGPRLRACQEI